MTQLLAILALEMSNLQHVPKLLVGGVEVKSENYGSRVVYTISDKRATSMRSICLNNECTCGMLMGIIECKWTPCSAHVCQLTLPCHM